MTKKEYKKYQEAVADFFEKEEIEFFSTVGDEPFISSQMCDCCGDNLQGSRVDAMAIHKPTGEKVEFIICTVCEYYIEYGQLDDLTMMKIQEGE